MEMVLAKADPGIAAHYDASWSRRPAALGDDSRAGSHRAIARPPDHRAIADSSRTTPCCAGRLRSATLTWTRSTSSRSSCSAGCVGPGRPSPPRRTETPASRRADGHHQRRGRGDAEHGMRAGRECKVGDEAEGTSRATGRAGARPRDRRRGPGDEVGRVSGARDPRSGAGRRAASDCEGGPGTKSPGER